MKLLKIGDQEFHTIEEFILLADLDRIKVIDENTGEKLNTYEYVWKAMRNAITEGTDETEIGQFFLDEFTYPENSEDPEKETQKT